MKLTIRPGLSTTLLKAAALMLLLIAAGSMARFAYATPTSIVDTTPGTATVDGTINPAEYSGSTEGINTGGARTIGEGAYLFVDSGGPLDEVVFGLQPAGDLAAHVVIYIDSVGGGLSDTTDLADTTDFYTKAISGTDGNGSAHLHFAPDFLADYAIVFDAFDARLYRLVEGTPDTLTYVSSANLTPAGNTAAGQFELSIAMANIGVGAGNSFKYVATLTAPHIGGFHRFNEFNGVSQTTYDAESAELQTDFNLASGDYHTFTTMGPTAMGHMGSTATLPSTSTIALALPLFAALLAGSALFLLRRTVT